MLLGRVTLPSGDGGSFPYFPPKIGGFSVDAVMHLGRVSGVQRRAPLGCHRPITSAVVGPHVPGELLTACPSGRPPGCAAASP